MKKYFLLPLFFSVFTLYSISVLVVGSGCREHALVWKLAQSEQVTTIFAAPGNGGTQKEPKTTNITIAATDIKNLLNFALEKNIDLTIVGPEAPLAEGITDLFNAHGLHCFGPTKAAAEIESSKLFAKQFMQKYNIPTAQYQACTSYKQAHQYIATQHLPIVIKVDGLAAGKGVFVTSTQQEVDDALDAIFTKKKFGNAGKKVIIEEYLEGDELSFMVVTDGTTIVSLETSQDYKRRYENNKGPNTGGMGAISPSLYSTPELEETIMNTIIVPTVEGLQKEGQEYSGVLYAGIMLTKDGPKVLEFNCRFGDPETEVLLARLESDLYQLCSNVVHKKLGNSPLQWKQERAVGVVMAVEGYPLSYKKGLPIKGLDTKTEALIFHATKQQDDAFVSNGGRVLCVVGLGTTVQEARKQAYQTTNTIFWKGKCVRNDIGL